MVINNIILFISIVNFILTGFVFFNAKDLKQHLFFFLFSFITTLWLFDNFLQRIFLHSICFQSSFGLGILLATTGTLWAYDLIGENIPKFMRYGVIPLSIIVALVSTFTKYVIVYSGDLQALGSVGTQKGVLFPVYALYVGFLMVLCVYKLANKALRETDPVKKNQFLLILAGAVIFTLFSYIVDFFIPLFFNSFQYTDLVTLTYFPLLVFVFYSITRHNLFGIKVIMTQFLVVIFLSLLFLNFLVSSSLGEYVWDGILMLISMVLSYLIIKNLIKESQLTKQLLEETKKTLESEQRLRKTFTQKLERKLKE